MQGMERIRSHQGATMGSRIDVLKDTMVRFVEKVLDKLLASPERDMVDFNRALFSEDERLVAFSGAPACYQEPPPQQ